MAIEIEVCPSDTIDNLKAKIQEFEGTPTEQQRLINYGYLGCTQLDNGGKLSDYNIKNGCTIYLVSILRGGMQVTIKAIEGGSKSFIQISTI